MRKIPGTPDPRFRLRGEGRTTRDDDHARNHYRLIVLDARRHHRGARPTSRRRQRSATIDDERHGRATGRTGGASSTDGKEFDAAGAATRNLAAGRAARAAAADLQKLLKHPREAEKPRAGSIHNVRAYSVRTATDAFSHRGQRRSSAARATRRVSRWGSGVHRDQSPRSCRCAFHLITRHAASAADMIATAAMAKRTLWRNIGPSCHAKNRRP